MTTHTQIEVGVSLVVYTAYFFHNSVEQGAKWPGRYSGTDYWYTCLCRRTAKSSVISNYAVLF